MYAFGGGRGDGRARVRKDWREPGDRDFGGAEAWGGQMARKFSRRLVAMVVCSSAAIAGIGCDESVTSLNRNDNDDAAGGDAGPMVDAGGMLPTGEGGVPLPVGDMGVDPPLPDALAPADAAPPSVCSEYAFRGQLYDCDALDRCIEDDFTYRLACCECDPEFCNPDPRCFEPDAVVPVDPADAGPPPPDLGPNAPDAEPPPPPLQPLDTCMSCHNGAARNDYSGAGLSNPHPFRGAANISCTGCHGGNGQGAGKNGSHVSPPPQIGNRQNLVQDPKAYFNRLTLTGIDKFEPQEYDSPSAPDGTWHVLDYLQFINPGDLRVVAEGRGCGDSGCHDDRHAQWVPRSAIATALGFFSSTRFSLGLDNRIPEYRGRDKDGDSLADSAPRNVNHPAYNPNNREVGEVGRLLEQPEAAQWNGAMRDNATYDANTLANHIINNNQDPQRPGRVRTGSPLDTLMTEAISITCGDCHLYSAGANNRYADFRSSGCTACHMEYSYDGRSRSDDPNVNRLEPADPDAIVAPERPHIEAHQIRNVAKLLDNGGFVRGISDRACVGCHQGSNRTVLQYWGVRLDQNQDVTNGLQYPANPQNFEDAAQDGRLYDPAVGNATFNGRAAAQHLVFEDYDGDNRDDTPADVHYDAGMGCIDCHGSRDLHGGTEGDQRSGKIRSRQDQYVYIECESCHGTVDGYAPTAECITYSDRPANCAVDRAGNPLRHVTRDDNSDYWLISRLNGQRHYIPQTKDVVANNNKRNPLTQTIVYNPKASYAMGRADGNPQTGIGPRQDNPQLVRNGFAHTDSVSCSGCHAAWVNNCIGCHLENSYDVNPANYYFSNITGERTLLFQSDAQFTYQSPVMMYLGVNSRGLISQIQPMDKLFYRYVDLNGNTSQVLAFSDRLGEGNNPFKAGANPFPALSHNQMGSHSIRGRVQAQNEGPRYCVACHLNIGQLENFGNEYTDFRETYFANDFANLDFDLLAQHIGQNTGNQLNSPIWVHQAAGLGTGLFLFDETGCPVNPLDANANRQYCPDGAPADNFDADDVVYDTDRIVEITGQANSSSAHPMLTPNPSVRRVGASNPEMSGPLGAQTIQKLADPNGGYVLDSWIDADGNAQGSAGNYIQ